VVQLLEELNRSVLLCDGAMGTELQAAGLEPGGCGEAWNLTQPDTVFGIHRRYVAAGADCLLTNSFGASRLALERHGLGDRVREINEQAVAVARRALSEKPGFVLGDIGPFGGLLAPLGEFAPEQVRAAFVEQAEALVDAGVDAIAIETQTSLEELGLAIAAARTAGAKVVIGSLAYDLTRDGSELRTMMGVDPTQGAACLRDAGADVLAINCGARVNAHEAARAISTYREIVDLPTMAQINAGQAELEGSTVVYRETPASMAGQIPELLAAGVAILGGCCGTTPAHIGAFRNVIDTMHREASR
jgi:5-methyltetrahydrofolate--homocysteine methyltransferase